MSLSFFVLFHNIAEYHIHGTLLNNVSVLNNIRYIVRGILIIWIDGRYRLEYHINTYYLPPFPQFFITTC